MKHLFSVVPEKVGPPALAKTLRSGRPALTVTWTAPQSERPITKYQVQYRRTSTTSWTTNDVRTRSVILENLPLGTSYKVQVRAVSDVGSGPFSDMRTNSTYRSKSSINILLILWYTNVHPLSGICICIHDNHARDVASKHVLSQPSIPK